MFHSQMSLLGKSCYWKIRVRNFIKWGEREGGGRKAGGMGGMGGER